MKYAVIGSGSRANAYIFEYDGTSFLVDNGFSVTELKKRMAELGFNHKCLSFILLTHTHRDHFHGVESASRKFAIPVFMNKELDPKQLFRKHIPHIVPLIPGKEYAYRSFTIIPFETTHDAPHSISFFINIAGTTVLILTDTGTITDEMKQLAKEADIIFCEANYSAEMLERGPYPAMLKARIRSAYGHLSNKRAIEFINETAAESTRCKLVYFCHISENNNSIERLEEEIALYRRFPQKYVICPRSAMRKGVQLYAPQN